MSHAFIHIYPPLNVESKSKIVYSSKTKVDERGKSVAKIENGKNQFKTNPNNHVKQRIDSLRLNNQLFTSKLELCATTNDIPCKFATRWSEVTEPYWPVLRMQYFETIAKKILKLSKDNLSPSELLSLFKHKCLSWDMVDISGITDSFLRIYKQEGRPLDLLKFEFAGRNLASGQVHLMKHTDRRPTNNRCRLVSRNIRESFLICSNC